MEVNDPVWHIKFYGTRGSTPVCEREFQQFGGNTTCIYIDLLVNDRTKLIAVFDAGTGIRSLGKDIKNGEIPNTESILLVFSHFHWDHIQGFPFFDPAYDPNQEITIFYPHQDLEIHDLRQIFEVPMQKEYFPVQLQKMGAKFDFFTDEEFKSYLKMEDYVNFTYNLHTHPGGAYGYRMDALGRSIIFCTDIEHGESVDPGVVEFCKDADILIHDAQYTDEELEHHRGWGHSSYSQAIEVAERAGVKKLVMTHHDPDHNDAFLEAIEKKCQERFPNCVLAREGQDFFI